MLNIYLYYWQTSLSDSSKELNYRISKTKFEFEEYFNVLNIGDAIRLSRFRTTNRYLPIETGRWRNIDRGNSYCNLCNCQKLGDEYHYVLECSSLNDKRKQLLPKYLIKRHMCCLLAYPLLFKNIYTFCAFPIHVLDSFFMQVTSLVMGKKDNEFEYNFITIYRYICICR
jgi:hypothetical protein